MSMPAAASYFAMRPVGGPALCQSIFMRQCRSEAGGEILADGRRAAVN